jgi:CheY-like chemotaxis protein
MDIIKNILLIDDDQDDRMLFSAALEHNKVPIHLEAVAGCDEAIENLSRFGNNLPDYILVDLNMPDVDGFECVEKIKVNCDWANLRIYIYSTSNSPVYVEKAREIGADGYIKKPIGFNDLCLALEKMLTTDMSAESGVINFK